MTVCCEHNPCPERPRFFLSRFEKRPWICPQCGTMWMTGWVRVAGSRFWSWEAA